jgi:branched-subunit amino acid ABC-type transport system permease component
MNPKVFSDELRRRNVYKVAIACAAVAWLLFEAVSVCLHLNDGPTWPITTLALFLLLGFALTVYISWAFEATPQGLKRTRKISREQIQALPYWSIRKFNIFIVTTALLAAALLVFDVLRSKAGH